jgi:hypothetical protein
MSSTRPCNQDNYFAPACSLSAAMAGLVPAIHVLLERAGITETVH